MDRTEWLACDDPARMLAEVRRNGVRQQGQPPSGVRCWSSERKLRLFAEACGRLRFCEIHQLTAEHMVRCVNDAPNRKHSPAVAALLREVVGDPFAPVAFKITQPNRWICAGCGAVVFMPPRVGFGYCDGCGTWEWRQTTELDEWRTPTVLALAQAAYDERAERWECKRCQQPVSPWFSHGHKRMWFACSDCRVSLPTDEGARHVEDGTLDPVRLLVLADALEEAGCDSEALLRHLRGVERVPITAEAAERSGSQAKWMDVPLGGPHVKGCWALDLILGKS